MHLIELLLPADATYAAKRRALADDLSKTFGGVTAFNRAPAKGLFEQGGTQVKDDIVVFERAVKEYARQRLVASGSCAVN